MSIEEVNRLKERIRVLEGEQKQAEALFASIFKLTTPQLKLLVLLYKVPSATSTVISQRLGISDVKVAVYRLRRQLAKGGHNIKVESHRNVGYWLDETSRELIKSLVTKPEQIAA